MLALFLLNPMAMAEPDWALTDLAGGRPSAEVVLIVATPGVSEVAYLPWAQAVEGAGMDAWILSLAARDQSVESASRQVGEGVEHLRSQRGSLRLLAHGYAGVLVLLAETGAERIALVGTPLSGQAMAPSLTDPGGSVAEHLPWPAPLLGELAQEPYSGKLDAAYRQWSVEMPALPPPQVPVLLLASGSDVVAPPEVVRLPSRDWPHRQWHRLGLLSLELEEPDHAQLLRSDVVARKVLRFLEEGT